MFDSNLLHQHCGTLEQNLLQNPLLLILACSNIHRYNNRTSMYVLRNTPK